MSKQHNSNNQAKSTMTRKAFLNMSGTGLIGVGFGNNLLAQIITNNTTENISMKNHYEVIIVGGSYSGLSAAMTLGRSLRKTLVIDSGAPCNKQTPHSHNLITQDGRKPADIANDARAQVLNYATVQIENDLVTQVTGQNGDFVVNTKSGASYNTKKLIFATGVKDLMPNIPGFAECWGITIIHCPYCHGYEVKAQKTGILVNNDTVGDFVKLIKNWSDEVLVFTNGVPQFDPKELDHLKVSLISKPIAQIEHQKGHLRAIQFQDGSQESLAALYHRPAFEQHCPIPAKLGCQLTDTGHIEVNQLQQTSVAGIYASGDSTTQFRAVSIAISQGNIAGAMLNHELINESY